MESPQLRNMAEAFPQHKTAAISLALAGMVAGCFEHEAVGLILVSIQLIVIVAGGKR